VLSTAACSGGSPHLATAASPTQSSPAQSQPTAQLSSPGSSVTASVPSAITGTVPNMRGMTLSGARSALYTAGFDKYSWLYGCHGSPDFEKVVKQTPSGRAHVPQNTYVHIYLQANNCIATLPNMVGMTLSSARSALAAAGFDDYSWLYGCHGSPDFEKVVKQTPSGRAQVPQNTYVHIYLQANNC